MTRRRAPWQALIIFIAIAIAAGLAAWASGVSLDAQTGAGPVCAFEIAGTWRPEATAEADPIFLNFSPEGWVSLLESGGQPRVRDFSIIAQAKYRLVVTPSSSLRIEFNVQRGNDLIPAGASAWEIAEYGDDRFTTFDESSSLRPQWARVQTHRYFLTLAGRPGTAQAGGLALAMLTKLDGQRTEVEALGLRLPANGAGPASAFGPLPPAVTREFARDDRRESHVMMRLELIEPAYYRTRRLLKDWEQRVKDARLPSDDPSQLMLLLLADTIASVNACRPALEVRETGAPHPQPLDLIRLIRTLNDRRHVGDDQFPYVWEPPPASYKGPETPDASSMSGTLRSIQPLCATCERGQRLPSRPVHSPD